MEAEKSDPGNEVVTCCCHEMFFFSTISKIYFIARDYMNSGEQPRVQQSARHLELGTYTPKLG